MKRLVVLISDAGKGSNLKAIISAEKSKKINIKIIAVISDTKSAYGLRYATESKIPIKIVSKKENLLFNLKKLNPDLIALAGWKQIILDEVIDNYPSRILNIHPGAVPNTLENKVLAPDKTPILWNRGKLTEKAIKNFIDNKSTYASSSIHFLTHEFDFGPVLGRAFEKIRKNDTVESLYKRLKKKEHQIYIKALKDLSSKAKILITDSGGRAHALAKKYQESENVSEVLVVPGNDLMTKDGIKIFPGIKTTDIKKILKIAKDENVDYVDVAQDAAVASGVTDVLKKANFKVFGPSKKAGEIEWDKSFSRNFMKKNKLPIPIYHTFTNQNKAFKFIDNQKDKQWYVKASGLAAGKGAIWSKNNKEVKDAVKQMKNFGRSGKKFLLEEKLTGEEFSAFALVSGKKFKILGYAQDHKAVYDGGIGPNTGGMGCISPPSVITKSIENQTKRIFKITSEGLVTIKRPYFGILYLGGIIIKNKVYIIEFNARWGDPEAQIILPSIQNDYFSLISQALEAKSTKIEKIKTDRKKHIVVAVTAKGYPGDSSKYIGREIKGFKDLYKNKMINVYGARVNIQHDKYISGGSRLFYITSEGKSIDEARKIAYNALNKIKAQNSFIHFRSDIGYKEFKRKKIHANRKRIKKN